MFNVADSAIVCGGILGALLALRGIEFDGSAARTRTADGRRRRLTTGSRAPRQPSQWDAVTSAP